MTAPEWPGKSCRRSPGGRAPLLAHASISYLASSQASSRRAHARPGSSCPAHCPQSGCCQAPAAHPRDGAQWARAVRPESSGIWMRSPTRTLPKVPRSAILGQPPPWGSHSGPVLGAVGSTLAGLRLLGLTLPGTAPLSSPPAHGWGRFSSMMSPGWDGGPEMKGDGQNHATQPKGLGNHSRQEDTGCTSASGLCTLSRLPPPRKKPGFTPSVWTCEHLSYVLGATPASETKQGPRQAMLCLPRLRCQRRDDNTSDPAVPDLF